jgi:hypothetical protein
MARSLILLSLLLVNVISLAAEPIAIGSRREFFVDEAIVAQLVGKADLQLHYAIGPNGFAADRPWRPI